MQQKDEKDIKRHLDVVFRRRKEGTIVGQKIFQEWLGNDEDGMEIFEQLRKVVIRAIGDARNMEKILKDIGNKYGDKVQRCFRERIPIWRRGLWKPTPGKFAALNVEKKTVTTENSFTEPNVVVQIEKYQDMDRQRIEFEMNKESLQTFVATLKSIKEQLQV